MAIAVNLISCQERHHRQEIGQVIGAASCHASSYLVLAAWFIGVLGYAAGAD